MHKGSQATLLYGGLSLGLVIALPLGLYSLGLRPPLLAWLAGTSLAAFVAYWADKQLGEAHELRFPEWVLLGLALVGGSPGALLGMLRFRHKVSERKIAFQIAFVCIVLLQAAALFVWLTRKP